MKPTKDNIISVFGEKALKRSAIRIGDGHKVIEKVLGGNFKHALEIGTYRGFTAAFMSQFVPKVSTIDLRHGRLEHFKDDPSIRQKVFETFDCNNVTIYLVEDDAEKKKIIDCLDFDFAFIDGAHDETVKDDFELVKKCGHVLFHDYDDSGIDEKNCVYNFINTLPREQLTIMDIFAYWENK